MWLNNFKIAVIEKNIDSIKSLLEEMPEFKDLNSMKEASYLIKEAAAFLQEKKSLMSVEMQQIRKNMDFLNSTNSNSKSSFDIKS
jgi:hypothetical protein